MLFEKMSFGILKQSQLFLEEMTVYLKEPKDSKTIRELNGRTKGLPNDKQLADIENESRIWKRKSFY